MAKSKVVMLTPEMSTEEALKLVKEGKVSIEAYSEWDAGRNKRANAVNGEQQISEGDFLAHGGVVKMVIEGQEFELTPRKFKTGSVGYNLNGKVRKVIKGKEIKLQVGVNLTVVGSKPPGEAGGKEKEKVK